MQTKIKLLVIISFSFNKYKIAGIYLRLLFVLFFLGHVELPYRHNNLNCSTSFTLVVKFVNKMVRGLKYKSPTIPSIIRGSSLYLFRFITT